jgi:hypothetical protein
MPVQNRGAEDADRKRPAAARVVDLLRFDPQRAVGARLAYRSPSSTPNEIVSDRS